MLTADERADLVWIARAQTYAEEALLYAGYLMPHVDEQNRAAMATMVRCLVRGVQRANLAAGFLCHVNMFDGDAGVALAAKPIPEWIAAAWPHLDGAIANWSVAATEAARAAGVAGKPADYYDSLRRIQTIHVRDGALASAQRVNRALTFLDPFPSRIVLRMPDGSAKEIFTVIGPHGSWGAHAIGWTALKMMTETQEFIADMLIADDRITRPDGTVDLNRISTAPFARMLLRTVNITRHLRNGWFNGLQIALTPAQTALNAFHLVVNGLLPALSHTSESGADKIAGAQYHFDQLTQDVFRTMQDGTVTRPKLRAAWNAFAMRRDTAWRFSGGWVKEILKFPEPDILQLIREQGKVPGSDPFDPPIARVDQTRPICMLS